MEGDHSKRESLVLLVNLYDLVKYLYINMIKILIHIIIFILITLILKKRKIFKPSSRGKSLSTRSDVYPHHHSDDKMTMRRGPMADAGSDDKDRR